MNNYLILATAILASGCAGLDTETRNTGNLASLAATAPPPNCRMGAVPVCTQTRTPAGESVSSCACVYVQGNVIGADAFSMRGNRRRH